MKKFLASILTVASLACIVLMIYFMLGVGLLLPQFQQLPAGLHPAFLKDAVVVLI